MRRASRVTGRRAGSLALGFVVGASLLGACATVTTAGGCGIAPGSVCPGTYMKGSKLAEADLYGADLDRADLRHAHLEDANLDGADLRRARLDGAWLEGATFVGALGVTADELAQGTVCRTVLSPGVLLSRDC